MSELLTFKEMVDSGADLYPSEVDTATKSEIYDWFQFRRVVDNSKFPVYFKRVLNRDYSRYRQLLRIEAGKQGDLGIETAFDWLVTNYEERQEHRTHSGSTSGTTSGSESKTTSGSTSGTQGGTVTVSGTGSTSLQHGHIVTGSGSYTSDTDVTSSDSRTTTATDSGSDSIAHTGEAHTGTANDTRARALSKTTPMQASYSSAEMSENNSRRGYVRDKSKAGYNVGSLEFSGSDDDNEERSYLVAYNRGFPDLDIDKPTSATDSFTEAGTVSDSKNDSTDRTTYGKIVTTADTDTASSSTDVSGTTSDTTTNSGTDVTTVSNSQTTTNSATTSGQTSGTETGTTSGSTSGTESGTDNAQAQHTGRSGEIAEILNRAQQYIKASSAFDWLRGQLETCFIANLDYVYEEVTA